MSTQSVARRLQRECGVAYNTALLWVRDEVVRRHAAVLKSNNLKRPFSDCLVEAAKKIRWEEKLRLEEPS